MSRYEEVTREKAEELKEEEKACEEQFKKEALELQETRRKLEEEKVRLEAQKECDSLEKEARQLKEQQGEMILAEDRIGQAQKAERLWKDLQEFLQGKQILTERKEKLKQLLGEQKKLEQEKAVLKEKVEKAREKKEKALPDLEIQRLRLEEGIALLAGMKTLEEEARKKKKDLEDRNRQLQEDQAKLEKLEKDLKLYEEKREEAALALSKVKVTAREQDAVQEGYRLWLELGRRKEEKRKKKRSWNSSVANRKQKIKKSRNCREKKSRKQPGFWRSRKREKRMRML